MIDQLQAKLVEIITSIQDATKAGADFALTQLPDIAQQYVLYGRVTATTWLAAAVLAFAAALYVALRHGFFPKDRAGMYWTEDGRLLAAVIASIATVAAGFLSMHFAGKAALVWFAPKVWLIKELADLVGGRG